jgi:hypothetical protein
MLKSRSRASRSRTTSVAALAAVATIVMGTACAASASPTRYSSPRAWLGTHKILAQGLHLERPMVRTAIAGGSQISIEQAPWQVAVLALSPVEEDGEVIGFVPDLCGGAILNEREVLTAAHCMFSLITDTRLPAEDVGVVAGVSDLDVKQEEHAQFREAGSLRVHPYYSYSTGASADDIAVVTLSNGLSLSSVPGSAVDSIGMVPAGAAPPEGSPVSLTGFGQENPNDELNGTLNSIGMTLGSSRRCGGEADAVFLCASASTGSGCFGDSGSALTTTDPTPMLVGVIDTVSEVSGEFCRAGSTDGFTNLEAPEIRGFIEGETAPPRAPRGGSAIEVSGVPKVGHALTCQPGDWSNQPTITYLFIDSSSGAVLQSSSSSTYQLSASDVGRTIFCEVQAANAGGTGVVRTTSLRAIEPAPAPPAPPTSAPPVTPLTSGATTGSGAAPPPAAGGVEAAVVHNEHVTLLGTTLTVESGLATGKLDCRELEGCNGVLVLTASQTTRLKSGKKKSRTVAIGTANFSLTTGETGVVKIHLNATGRALLSGAHGHLAANLAIEVIEAPTLKDSVRLVAQVLGRGSRKGKR